MPTVEGVEVIRSEERLVLECQQGHAPEEGAF